jgi:TPP-dependent pyruvate/acetoin dehydrogenase alpha subunit
VAAEGPDPEDGAPLLKNRIASRAELEEIRAAAEEEVREAHDFARRSPFPKQEDLRAP